MALAHFQKTLLQINLITDENDAGAYHSTFYRIERILTALDIIATTFLLIIDFLSFVRQDINNHIETTSAAWNLGWFKVYLITLVIKLVTQEVICGRTLFGHQSY